MQAFGCTFIRSLVKIGHILQIFKFEQDSRTHTNRADPKHVGRLIIWRPFKLILYKIFGLGQE